MKYGIIGSRSRKDKETVEKYVQELPNDAVVVSGGCRGVDTWAEQAAIKKGLQTVIFRPNLEKCWYKHEFTKAYYARNKLIAENSDVIVAFVSANRKGGTEHTIKEAEKLGKQIVIIPPNHPNQFPASAHDAQLQLF